MKSFRRILPVVVFVSLSSQMLMGQSIDGGVIQIRMPNEDVGINYYESRGGMTIGLAAESASVEGRKLYIGDGKVAVVLQVIGPAGSDGIMFQDTIKVGQGHQFKKGSVVKVLPGYKRCGQLSQGDIYVTLPGVKFQLPNEKDEKKGKEPTKGQTVVIGTNLWDIETNNQGDEPNADVFWEQTTETEKFLNPQNGAGLALVDKLAFDKITREDLAALKYAKKPLPYKLLAPGTVVALQTNEGNYAKLKVVKYRDMNDFTFPEAKLLDAKRRDLFESGRIMKNYHIEIEWILYR